MPGQRLRARAVIALAGLSIALSPAAPALAHTELVSTSPRAGSTVWKSRLGAVRITFGQQIQGGTVRVTDRLGRTVSVSSGRDPANVRRLRAVLRRDLRGGRYTVRWTIEAADGHDQRGSFWFRAR